METEKLYIVVRRDLPAGDQAAQCCHALRTFAALHPELDRQWHARGGNIVLLSVADQAALQGLVDRAVTLHVSCAAFHEEDLDGALTAAAFAASARRLLSSLPLALRGYRSAA